MQVKGGKETLASLRHASNAGKELEQTIHNSDHTAEDDTVRSLRNDGRKVLGEGMRAVRAGAKTMKDVRRKARARVAKSAAQNKKEGEILHGAQDKESASTEYTKSAKTDNAGKSHKTFKNRSDKTKNSAKAAGKAGKSSADAMRGGIGKGEKAHVIHNAKIKAFLNKKGAAKKATKKVAKAAARKAVVTAGTAAKGGQATAALASNPVGWIILIIALIIFIVIVVVISSYFAGLGASQMAQQMGGAAYMDTKVVTDIKAKVNREWFDMLAATRRDVNEQGFENANIRVRYNYTTENDNDGMFRIDNWNDVLAVWLVQNDRVITDADYEAVRNIYFAMNPLVVSQEEVPIENTELPPEAPPIDPEAEVIPEIPLMQLMVNIDIQNLRYQDVQQMYSLTAQQMEQIQNWLNPTSDQSPFWYALLGEPVAQGSDYTGVYTNLPAGAAVTSVLDEAARRNGWIYDNDRRGTPGYDDCSSFVWGCYMTVGIDFGNSSYPPTAASIAQWCDERNLRVSEGDLQAGDLIFWSGSNNGRYLNIYHVAIYVGDGKMWESAPSAGGVVFRNVSIQSPKKILFYARPTATS